MIKNSELNNPVLMSHRDSIDRLDTILVYTLAERFKHTEAIGKLKAKKNLAATDPDRELTQMKKIEQLSKNAGLDHIFAKKILTFIISEVIKNHKILNQQTENN